jgi:hypothetical protein
VLLGPNVASPLNGVWQITLTGTKAGVYQIPFQKTNTNHLTSDDITFRPAVHGYLHEFCWKPADDALTFKSPDGVNPPFSGVYYVGLDQTVAGNWTATKISELPTALDIVKPSKAQRETDVAQIKLALKDETGPIQYVGDRAYGFALSNRTLVNLYDDAQYAIVIAKAVAKAGPSVPQIFIYSSTDVSACFSKDKAAAFGVKMADKQLEQDARLSADQKSAIAADAGARFADALSKDPHSAERPSAYDPIFDQALKAARDAAAK